MAIKIETEGKKVGISVSMGAIFITPNHGTKPNHLYSLADKLLYQSKAGGRNRLVLAEIGFWRPTLAIVVWALVLVFHGAIFGVNVL